MSEKRQGGQDRFVIGVSRLSIAMVMLLAVVVSARASDSVKPIEFPRDDGPHDAATEWWYYTGHVFTESGDLYGFEYVFFKVQGFPRDVYVAHFAVTDSTRGRFIYQDRMGPVASVSDAQLGFDLTLGPWTMRGADGEDELFASMPGYVIDLRLSSAKPPVLHDGDGYIDYGDMLASYYYSRTRMDITGQIRVDDESFTVTGEAWMDHQWLDSLLDLEQIGWDWVAIQLDDGTELMVYHLRDADDEVAFADGSYIAEDGALTILGSEDFDLTSTGIWTSPHSGATYPSGWTVEVPAKSLSLSVEPVMLDQELDTSATTGVIYWEGQVEITGKRANESITGLGFVELTGYAREWDEAEQ